MDLGDGNGGDVGLRVEVEGVALADEPGADEPHADAVVRGGDARNSPL